MSKWLLHGRFVHNKTIQKICESLRVSKEDKEKLRLLKK